jgi:hypothetical protein
MEQNGNTCIYTQHASISTRRNTIDYNEIDFSMVRKFDHLFDILSFRYLDWSNEKI